MGRRVVRGSVPQIMRTVHQYLFYRDQAAEAERQKKAAYDPKKNPELRNYVLANGELTPEGHVDWLFEEPLTIGASTYLGLRNQMSPGEDLLDTERAEKLLVELGLRDQVIKPVTTEVAEWDELYVLNQKGLITDEQLDSLFDPQPPSFSLVVIK